mmetsp:Transcript_11502/g.17280  ORF Transcript_11502/g.17280 Transcript_11502/m.17280 type:complete len:122 (+) Transcript_11502:1039-1404(+)
MELDYLQQEEEKSKKLNSRRMLSFSSYSNHSITRDSESMESINNDSSMKCCWCGCFYLFRFPQKKKNSSKSTTTINELHQAVDNSKTSSISTRSDSSSGIILGTSNRKMLNEPLVSEGRFV